MHESIQALQAQPFKMNGGFEMHNGKKTQDKFKKYKGSSSQMTNHA